MVYWLGSYGPALGFFLIVGGILAGIWIYNGLTWLKDRKEISSQKVGQSSVNQPLTPIIGQTFQNETVVMDGYDYVDCQFENCTFQWERGVWKMSNSESKNHRFLTKTKVIVETVDILKFLHLLDARFAEDWKHLGEGRFRP